ncbi:MAG: hypothetical protein VXW57_08955 [Pseudomonadota bacterium]|nr:hypothetical protein [Pseudomonadota bacterium]
MELLAAYAPWQIAAALGAALGSAFVRGLTGFGMAILLVPILALALPPVESVLLANFLSLCTPIALLTRMAFYLHFYGWGCIFSGILVFSVILWIFL